MSEENLVGQIVAGKYRVEKVLGKGGMGVVIGARHMKLDEPVAIKLLRPAMMEVPGMVARFLREARAASKIKSDHVVRVTDVDTLEDGIPYMVMEYLEGIDFSDLRKQQGFFGVTEAVGYVLQACDAIAEAHSLGIVHRDLKPSNLFLHQHRGGKRIVKVLDFGISKLESPSEQEATRTGQMMGSPKYMSPEQMISMHDVDGRSDIWSLGTILFELLCGRPPFVAESTPRICALVLNTDPPLPSGLRPDLPPGLETIIVRCLEKEPERRYPDVKALVEALAPFGPAPDAFTTTGAQAMSIVAMRTISPMQPPLTTPTPGATVAPWDTSKPIGSSKKAGLTQRIVTAGLVVLVVASTASVFYMTCEGSGSTSSAPATGPLGPPTVVLHSLTSSAPTSSPMTADMEASATPLPSSPPPAAAAAALTAPARESRPRALSSAPSAKPSLTSPPSSVVSPKKSKPAADPFGGRRN